MFKKRIVINNKKDLNRFYNNLKYYRSILFVFTKFYSDNKEIETFITALNIKNRFKRIRYCYDAAIKQINDFEGGCNFCKFDKNGVCRNGLKNGCCRYCFHVGDKGCTSENLSCKLFYCSKVYNKHKIVKFDDLKILRCLSFRCRTIIRHDFFTKKEDVLMDLYIGSILILFVRYFYRFIKQEIIKLFRKIKKKKK